MSNQISAKIIADSLTERGHRLTTFILTMPRIILAEFNTHRMISRNSAPSRAIPFKKMAQSVMENPFIPIRWMKDHSGMQGMEYLSTEGEISESDMATSTWLSARDWAIKQATALHDFSNVSKQMCNRLLEPFMYRTVIATASEWQNFFALRAHEAAEIHMQDLTYKMLDVYNTNQPQLLKPGEWHIPFGDKIDRIRLRGITYGTNLPSGKEANDKLASFIDLQALKVAVARCARVSYTEVGVSLEGSSYENDIKLHDRLLALGHMSPFEHCAKVMTDTDYALNSIRSSPVMNFTEELGWSGNFRGFIQYRKMLPNENRTDDRVQSAYDKRIDSTAR